VLLTLNLNDTILQKENAFIFQQITCGKAALCYMQTSELCANCGTGILACVDLRAIFSMAFRRQKK
jgi:hypothetical protein